VNRDAGWKSLVSVMGFGFLFSASANYNDDSLARQMRIHMRMAVQTYSTNGDERMLVSAVRSDAGMLWLHVVIGHGRVEGRGYLVNGKDPL